MLSLVRAGLAAALVAVACLAANAADKPFQDSDLADSAVALEAKIKADAGAPSKPLAQIRRDADAAFSRNDFRNGMALLGQIVAAAPNDGATWLRLARTIMQIRPSSDDERKLLLERASSAAYIAYLRAPSRSEEADSLALLGNVLSQRTSWRPALDAMRLSLELHEAADLRGQYERLREQYGFRVLDYSIDADTASPRACFQFSEDLPARVDFSPFVALAGADKPALSAAEKQLCVEGLKHGETYTVTLRTGLPSIVHETLSQSKDFSIYVRDRKPLARFASNAYVLPRSGQRGIPIVSVNSRAIAVEILRIDDRNLVGTLGGSGEYDRGDFKHSLNRYEIEQLRQSRGVSVWKGELAVESPPLNTDVTTAFPVDSALGDLKPGVYVIVAQPKELKDTDNDYGSQATQWFVVSDLGLTAFSGNDGIHAYVHSLATTDTKSGIELRLISRSNEVLATRRTDGNGHAQFEAALASGEGGAAPALLTAADAQGDYAFLSLTGSAFDLSDRGVSGRAALGRPRRLRLCRTGRLSHRGDRLSHRTPAGRAGRRRARRAADARRRAARRRRIPAHGGAGPGPGRSQPGFADHRFRADRDLARARLHRPEAAGGRRDHVSRRGLRARPDRVRSHLANRPRLAEGARHGGRRGPLPLRRAGSRPRPRRRRDRRGGQGARRFPRLRVRPCRRGGFGRQATARGLAGDRRRRQGEIQRQSRQAAGKYASARSEDRGAHGRGRRPRGRAHHHPAGEPERRDDRRQAAVFRALAQRRRHRRVRCHCRHARWHRGRAARPALRAAARRHPLSVLQARRPLELRAGEDDDASCRRNGRCRRRQAGAHLAAGDVRPLSP